MSNQSDAEKEMLIESMSKLIEHIHQNKIHQKEIFDSLTTNDLNKILSNIEDKNIKLRKTSCRFLCEILYENNLIQEIFCQLIGILNLNGKICLNKINSSFFQHLKYLPEIFENIKNSEYPKNQNGLNPLCWYVQVSNNAYNKVQFIYPYDKNNSLPCEFLDPQECIFGIQIESQYKPQKEFQREYVKEYQKELKSVSPIQTHGK
ncbi:hypothetical protein IMG5_116480, partial [Ichthyophthirius multifiliis]